MTNEIALRLRKHGPQDERGLSALETFALDELLLAFADELIAGALGQSRAAITTLRETPEKAVAWKEMLTRSVHEGETLRARSMQRRKVRAATVRREERAFFGTRHTGTYRCDSVAEKTARRTGWQDAPGWLTLLLIASVLAGMFAAHHHLGLMHHLAPLFAKGIS